MRLQLATLGVLFGAALLPITEANAQFSEAMSALKSAARDVNRALNGRSTRSRGRRSRRSSLLDEGPPPLPLGNPKRHRAGQLSAGIQQSTTQRKPARSAGGGGSTTPNPAAKNTKLPPALPAPDVWTPQQIAKARRQCRAILRKVRAKFEPADPIKRGPCGDAAPYRLSSLGQKHRVVFKPAPVLNCKMIQALDIWFRKGLQPLANRHLGGPITNVSVMSSYSCRNAYGRKKTRLSEHGKANALDIGGFRTKDGVTAYLLADWGPTRRDLIAKAKREQAERLKAAKIPSTTGSLRERDVAAKPTVNSRTPRTTWRSRSMGSSPSAPVQDRAAPQKPMPVVVLGTLAPPLPDRRPSLRERLDWAKAERARKTAQRVKSQRGVYKDELNNFLYPRQDLGGPKANKSAVSRDNRTKDRGVKLDKKAFLKGAHHTACKIFGTVLGPEANDAHRDHFHVDLAERRHRNYCR
ncbi:MAG: extensin family protein [Pseudomonadota bacterium]